MRIRRFRESDRSEWRRMSMLLFPGAPREEYDEDLDVFLARDDSAVFIDWADSWVHARASNTEPIMRIIAEAPTREEAQSRVDQVRVVVNRILS